MSIRQSHKSESERRNTTGHLYQILLDSITSHLFVKMSSVLLLQNKWDSSVCMLNYVMGCTAVKLGQKKVFLFCKCPDWLWDPVSILFRLY
jgi:hypothetical protein